MPKLRDYTQSLMNPESTVERDEDGNLTIKQVQDADPYQAGIQAQADTPSPVDPNAKPIFMTNIPQGGMGPSLDAPGGVPGSEQDRAQIDEQAQAAGTTVMDLSSKQKTPKPPAWVNPDVDLNAPGERDRFKQTFREDTFGGVNLPDVDPIGEASRKWDPALYPKEFKQLADTLTTRVKAAREVEDRIMAEFDKNAAIQASMRKHKSETAKGQLEARDKDEKRLLELSGKLVNLAGERRKLKKEQTEAGMDKNNPAEMVSINRLNAQVDSQQKSIQAEIERLEARLGRKAPAQAAAVQAQTTQTPTGKPTTKSPAASTPQQTEAQKFAAEGKAKGWTPDQVLAEWKKLKTSGAGTKTPAAKQAPSPARIVKPAPTSKPSGVTGSWGPPPPSASKVAGSGVNIGGPPVTINTKDMAELADSVGINKENLDIALKAAAAAGGFTIDVLLTKPKNVIKRLLEMAVSSQSATRKQMGL